jgi:hypothetical protein
MATMAWSGPRRGAICSALALAACVSEHTVEDDVRPAPGAVQPDGGGGASVPVAAACERLVTARSDTASKLGCDLPKADCPGYLLVAGSVPCDEFTGGSVGACEARISAYEKCADFSAKPCVVTPVQASCKKPLVPEAGPKDAGAPPKAKDAGAAD